jgi:hypothetical protein
VTWAPYAGSICLANAAKPSRWFFIPAIATKPQPNGSIPAGNAPQTESALNAGRVEQKLGAVGPVGLPFFVRLDLGRICCACPCWPMASRRWISAPTNLIPETIFWLIT